MKIFTWNVNGIRAVERKGELQNFIANYSPDVLFLQEIKWTPDKFSEYLITPPGYEAFYNPAEKAWYAGTGIWIKDEYRKYIRSIETGFENDPTANEGRVSHLILEKDNEIFDLFGIYFPNGGKSEEAWAGKLDFFKNFLECVNSLREAGHMVLWCGDINIAHNEIDLARPKQNEGKIGFHPSERAWLDRYSTEKWSDIWRVKNPEMAEVYSWWDVKTRSRETNIGWRIDAIWWEEKLFEKTKNIWYTPEQIGSDHCPMWIEVDF